LAQQFNVATPYHLGFHRRRKFGEPAISNIIESVNHLAQTLHIAHEAAVMTAMSKHRRQRTPKQSPRFLPGQTVELLPLRDN
jgi:hypothetical protein